MLSTFGTQRKLKLEPCLSDIKITNDNAHEADNKLKLNFHLFSIEWQNYWTNLIKKTLKFLQLYGAIHDAI